MKLRNRIMIVPVLLTLTAFVGGNAAVAAEQAGSDKRFGVMTHYAHGWDQRSIPSIPAAGIASVRDELYWREVEPEKGVFRFPAVFDSYMARLAQGGVEPFIVLSFENGHYDDGATPHTDEGIAAYARYGAEVLRHYGPQIKAVEIWNEYNGTFVSGPAQADRSGTYLRMLQAAYTELKRTRPDVVVVGGATAGVPLPYWEKLLQGGALAHLDVVSVHPYRYDSPPEGIETDIAELAALIARYNNGEPKPIWVTEIGWGTQAAVAPGDLAIDDTVQAQFLVRAYALLFSAKVKRVFWYLLRDYEEFAMGLLRNDAALSPKPAYTAMANMIRQLHGAEVVGREPTLSDLYSVLFRGPDGKEVRVLWSLQARTLALSGVTGVVDLMGRPLGYSGTLRVGPSPIFVTGTMRGLPVASEKVVADSRQGFSAMQGERGWSYGFVRGTGDVYEPLPVNQSDDWRAAWLGPAPYLWVTAADQHPSVIGGVPVAVVRRWKSDREGRVRVAGSFRGGKYGGDGVGVGIVIDGKARLNKILSRATAVSETFDFTQRVQPGTTIDFFVNPGPAASIDHDATAVAVTISTTER